MKNPDGQADHPPAIQPVLNFWLRCGNCRFNGGLIPPDSLSEIKPDWRRPRPAEGSGFIFTGEINEMPQMRRPALSAKSLTQDLLFLQVLQNLV